MVTPRNRSASLIWCNALAIAVLAAGGCDGGGGNDPPPPAGGSGPPAPTPPPSPPPTSAAPGLDARPSNTSCHAWDKPTDGASIALERFTQLTFSEPVNLLQAPHDDATWYVVEIEGVVRKFSEVNATASSVFVDLSGPVTPSFEGGLLGMTFHPDYPQDPRAFFLYTARNGALFLRLSSVETTNAGATLNPATEQVLMEIEKPQTNHNGGHLAFGPDGYLYLGVGDGGGANDEHGETGNGQRLTTMLGKMLRIDVDSARPYAIPPSNPFAQNPMCPAAGRASGPCPEIFAYGFRNPWRWSFDRSNGALWLGDVGQSQWEEIDIVRAGRNYGWRCREGAHNFRPDTPGCAGAVFEEPVAEYSHREGRSVTGGYVYRGVQPTALVGRYIFGDFVNGQIWAWMDEEAPGPRRPTPLLSSGLNIVSFAESNRGELFVVHYGAEGTLHRMVFEPPVDGVTVPAQLSATGCVNPQMPTQPAAGLIPYAINAPFWSDGAEKERWLALPDGAQITVQDGDWEFPPRSVLMKSFRVADRLVETRLLMRHPDGSWGGYTYEWNEQQTEAELLRSGAERDIGGGRTWIFPSESDCMACHTSAAGRALGPETSQLNRTMTYPQTGRTANELTTLSHIGLFTTALPSAGTLPALPDPTDTAAPLADRARAWLHTNCAQCHRENGPTPSTMDLRYTTPLGSTNACNVAPSAGRLGLGASARLIAPGSAANSIIVNRMSRRDRQGMPPIGSNQIDAAGVALVSEWIHSLTACPEPGS